MMNKKVIILLHKLQHYRVPILNLMADEIDITVACDNIESVKNKNIKFKLISVGLKKVGPFVIHDNRVSLEILNNYDVVISLLNIRCLDIISYLFCKRDFKLILWGIGVTASYTKSFDEKGLSSRLREFIALKSDALIFYSQYPVERYLKLGYDKNNIFVANNTVDNLIFDIPNTVRDQIIFVGTLYEGKGIIDLLDSYRNSIKYVGRCNMPHLKIIGDGSLKQKIITFICDHNLTDLVELKGPIYDKLQLNKCFENAIACISPKQAGLSVLTSMSNGVPFITTKSAITGGEIFNISHGVNGIILDCCSNLTQTICDIVNNPSYYRKLGFAAHRHYLENRTPQQMAKGLISAVKGVL